MTEFEKRGLFRALEGGAFAATNATITGNVTLGEDAGIWFGSSLRASAVGISK